MAGNPQEGRLGAGGGAAAQERVAPGPGTTRARLLESGRELFARHGLHGVTTHDIAHGAGMAAGTFYLHFKDKHELFARIVKGGVAELRRRVRETGEGSSNLEQAARDRAEAMIGFAEDHREIVRILFSGDGDTVSLESDVLEGFVTDIVAIRTQLVASGRASAELDADVRAQAVVGMWSRIIAWWAEEPGRAPRQKVIDTLTHIQLRGTEQLLP